MALIDKKVSEIYAGRDISSLSDTPSKDGMSASELKARFDQLNKEVIPNYNDLIDELITYFADIETGKINSDGSESNINEIQFDETQTDTPSGEGAIVYNADEKTFQGGLGNGVVGDFFRETFYPKCKNNDTVTINDGDFVMYDGTSGASGIVLVKKASTNLVLAGMGMGIATETISKGQSGNITWFGLVRGVNTTGSTVGETWVDGDILYNSGTVVGGLSKTKPVAPKPAIMVAVVHRSHATKGQLLVRPMYFPNLTQLSDVYTSSIANGDALWWNSSTARFENIQIYSKSQIDSLFTANSLADRARANHTGTQSADTLVDGTTNKAFLSTERTKLAGIEAGAEVNNISDLNATDLTDGGETSLHIHDARYYTETELNNGQLDNRYFTETEIQSNYYNKTEIDGKLTSMYKFKGSVATYANLPTTGQVAGDVWNVIDTGQNYAWTGTAWDDIGGTEILASDDDNGLMSKEDFTRLKNVEASAEVNQNAYSVFRVTDGVVSETISADSKEDEIEFVAGTYINIAKVDGKIEISSSGDIEVDATNVTFTPYGNITGTNVQEALEDVSDLQDTTLFTTEEEIFDFSINKNADTLDGHDYSYFATADHNHTGLYSPVGHDHDDRYYTESEVNSLVNAKASITSYSATLPSASWTGSSAPYLKEVTISGIVNTDEPIIDIVPTGTYATDIAMQDNWGKIYRAVTSTNMIIFYAKSIPSADIPLKVKVIK